MPLTGNMRQLRGWATHVQSLGKPNGPKQVAIAKAVGHEVRELLKKQFATGTGPEGPWKRTVRGEPALISRKLPGDFKTSAVASGVFVSSRIPWLRAHHEGHTFPARSAGGQALFFNKKGRFVSRQRYAGAQHLAGRKMAQLQGALNLLSAVGPSGVGLSPKAAARKATSIRRQLAKLSMGTGFEATARRHTIRARVLARRPVYPDDMRRGIWGQAIARGFTKAAAGFGVLR
jgi:hypothetical protein